MDQGDLPIREIAPGATCAPTPAWVDLQPYTIPPKADPRFIAAGLCVLLDDSQIDLCGPERAWHYRRAEIITAPAGAERAAQFTVAFDPNYERIEIHSIAVIRNGQRIEHSGTANFDVLRRERNLEMLHYDGRLTVCVTLPDVRPGDVVECAHTLYGMRKSLGDRHSTFIPFEWEAGIVEVRVRLRAPKTRVVRERSFNNPPAATHTEADGIVDRRWRSVERAGMRYEPLAPPWIIQSALVQMSEWRDWTQVAETYTPLYEDDGALSADVEAELTRIAQAEKTNEGKAAAILNFTQGAVRYLAISIGEGGYTPRPIGDICSTRYGDCKDKSKLFATMARRLGLDACPALVNTRDGPALDGWLPTAQAFDHCIVRLAVDGKVYWLDPTRSAQPSPLPALSQCHYGWALPLRPGVTALERMPDPTPAHTLQIDEKVALGASPDKPVRYEWKTTSRRGRAEWVRNSIAREGSVGLFKSYAEDVGRRYETAKPVRQDVVTDDAQKNVIATLEVYEITGGWIDGGGSRRHFATHDISMRTQLAPLDAGARKQPIYLGQVGQVSRRVEIEMMHDISGFDGWERSVDASTLSFSSKFRKEGPKHFILEQKLDFRALTLPAAEADKYRAIVAELDQSDIVITGGVGKKGMFIGSREHQEEERKSFVGSGWAWTVIWLGLVGVYWVWRYNGSPSFEEVVTRVRALLGV